MQALSTAVTGRLKSAIRSSTETIGTAAMTASPYAIMLTFAVSISLIGPTLPAIMQDHRLRLSTAGLIMTFQSVGGLLAVSSSGFLSDSFGKVNMVVWGLLGFFGSLIFLSLAPTFTLLLTAFFLAGGSTRLIDTALNAFIADLYGNRKAPFLSLLHAFFGIGAFLGPLYGGFMLVQGIRWVWTFRILSFIVLPVAFLFFMANRNYRQINPHPSNRVMPTVLLRSKSLRTLCFVMACYTGHQSGLITWIYIYLKDFLRATPATSSLGLSVFWFGVVLGRLACARLSRQYGARTLLMASSFAGTIILAIAFLTGGPVVMVVLIGLVGIVTGGIIPLLVASACNQFPNQSGTASSLIFTSGMIGSMIFPWVIGVLAEKTNIHASMFLTVVMIFGAFVGSSLIPDGRGRRT